MDAIGVSPAVQQGSKDHHTAVGTADVAARAAAAPDDAFFGTGGGGAGGGAGPASGRVGSAGGGFSGELGAAASAAALALGVVPPVAAGLSVVPATPPHLLQLEKFVLITDEGGVAVRARLNGTVGYLKRQAAMQLHISPRLALTITAPSSSSIPLADDAIISPYAEGKSGGRLQLSAAPRPLSDFFLGAPGLPTFRQVRVRPIVRGAPQAYAVVVKGVDSHTTVREVQQALAGAVSLLPVVQGHEVDALSLLFSPVFITPDVLLGRKAKQVLAPTQTLGAAQVVEEDLLYLAID